MISAFGGAASGHHGAPIGDALIFLAAAVLFAPLLKRLRFSLVLGYLAAGAMIGPHGLAMVQDIEETRELADIGVVFLLFAIGLELSFERLKVMRRLVFGLGAAQVVLTGLAVAVAAVFWGETYGASVVIGAALALSSTAFVLQLMNERGELATRHGRATFSTLLFQDLAVVPILVVVPLLAGDGGGESILIALGLALLKAVVALTAIVIAGRQLLRPLYHLIAAVRAPELFTAMTLLVVLGIGWATQQVGLSMALGAFLAGLLLSESEFRHQVEADIEPFRGILLGLFFMTVGMTVDVGLALREFATVLLFLLGLVGVKLLIVVALALAFRLPFAAALRTGALLAQGGEFAFVILGVAGTSGLISTGISDLLFLVIALSMATTPVVVWGASWLAARFEHRDNLALGTSAEDTGELENHVILAGFGRVGRTVARLLEAWMVPYVAVDTDAHRVREGRREGLPVYYGDASRPDVLRQLGGERARAVVVTLTTAGQAVDRTVSHLHDRLPELPIFARARDPVHARHLEELGAAGTVLETLEASLQLGGEVLHRSGASWQAIEELIRQMRFVDGIGRPLGARPSGGADDAGVPLDPVVAAAMMVEDQEAREEAAEAEGEGTADAEPAVGDRAATGEAPGTPAEVERAPGRQTQGKLPQGTQAEVEAEPDAGTVADPEKPSPGPAARPAVSNPAD